MQNLFPKISLNLITWKLFWMCRKRLDKAKKQNLRKIINYCSSPNTAFKNNLTLNPLFMKTPIQFYI